MMSPMEAKELWASRSPRERRMLAVGAACAGLLLLYAALWEPGLAARQRLAAALPTMRAQVEQMRSQQREIASLRRSQPPGAASSNVASLLQAAAARSAIGNSIERIDAVSPQRARISSPAISFDAWLLWIAGLQREFGIRVETCNIGALERPGMVRVEAVLAAATDEAP